MKYHSLQPEQITVGKRFREDLGDIETLAESILDKGIIQPIVVNKDMQLVAGGRRLAAFQLAREQEPDNPNLKAIPAVSIATKGDLELRELELIENIQRKDMTWHEQAELVKEIHSHMVAQEGDKWPLRKTAEIIGYSVGSISDQISIATALEHFPELRRQPSFDAARKVYKKAVEHAEVAKARAGNHEKTDRRGRKVDPTWEGKEYDHNYWTPILSECYQIGDAIEGMESLPENHFHLAEVDPPYGVDITKEKSDQSANIHAYNEVEKSDYPEFLQRTAAALYRVMAPNSVVIWWFGPTWHNEVLATLRRVGFHVDDIPAIWFKAGSGAGSNNPDIYLARAYEPFFVCRKGSPVFRQRGRANVFAYPAVPHQRKRHPTQRPIELIRDIITTFVYPGANIIVPFLGSGATIIAGMYEGVDTIIGYDLSEVYLDSFCLAGSLELVNKSREQLQEEAFNVIDGGEARQSSEYDWHGEDIRESIDDPTD